MLLDGNTGFFANRVESARSEPDRGEARKRDKTLPISHWDKEIHAQEKRVSDRDG
jgi:hypothetical protein